MELFLPWTGVYPVPMACMVRVVSVRQEILKDTSSSRIFPDTESQIKVIRRGLLDKLHTNFATKPLLVKRTFSVIMADQVVAKAAGNTEPLNIANSSSVAGPLLVRSISSFWFWNGWMSSYCVDTSLRRPKWLYRCLENAFQTIFMPKANQRQSDRP